MDYMVAHIYPDGKIAWEDLGTFYSETENDGLTINIPGNTTLRETTKSIVEYIRINNIDWIKYEPLKLSWIFNSRKFKEKFPRYKEKSCLKNSLVLEPEFFRERNHISFVLTPEIIKANSWKKIKNILNIGYVRILKPLISLVISRAIVAIMEHMGLDPTYWLITKFMTTPTSDLTTFMSWLVTVAFAILLLSGYCLWKKYKQSK